MAAESRGLSQKKEEALQALMQVSSPVPKSSSPRGVPSPPCCPDASWTRGSGQDGLCDVMPSPRNGAGCCSLTACREALVESSRIPPRPSLRYGLLCTCRPLLPQARVSRPLDTFSFGIQDPQPLIPLTLGAQEFRPPAPQGSSCRCPQSSLMLETTFRLSRDLEPLFSHLRNGLAPEPRARASGNWWVLCDPCSSR